MVPECSPGDHYNNVFPGGAFQLGNSTLFLTNGNILRDWLSARPGSLIDRLNAQKDAGLAAEELYLSVLSRMPTADERKEIADYLTRRNGERLSALQDLAWALLTSAEFRFNH